MGKTMTHIPHIGMRIIKSAFGVLICFAIYFIRGKQGTPFYSALAVLWCIQNQTKNTVGNALQRTVGTGIGALYGLTYILVKRRFPLLGDSFLHYCIISLTLIPIIYTTVVLKQKKASYFSCVVFLSIVVNHLMDSTPYIFVANRTLDTLIGIFVGLVLNSVSIHGEYDTETLFIADLDRSMDGFSSGITPYSKVMIQNMLEKDMKLTFMTKRTPAGFLEGMPDIKPKIPIIAMDGAILYDIKENRYPKVYVISAEHACNIEHFIRNKGFNIFTTIILEDVLIIYYDELKNVAEKDIYGKMHRSPYRNYLNKKRPKNHPVVYMMCIDKTEKIEQLLLEIEKSDIYHELKILVYPSDDYKGYSYIKIYNKNASVQNMTDYLSNMNEAEETVTFSDDHKGKANYCFTQSDQIVRKLHHLFYFKKRGPAYEQ
ncbi:MAG: FUSC family protein [Butyrivibrio sp.]|jgi:hydroxymethylpyrimidine pyrophosphatase-like HAD family hydrolase|nr:aromatic acid exporter family protein [Butyrivibrio sp.]MCR4637094.1 FUSC family protein [Butyrivibrio sp.]